MILRLAGLSLAACLLAAAASAAPGAVVQGSVAVCDPNAPQNCQAPNARGQVPTTDPNNASYSSATPLTVGAAPVPATRGIAADCTAGGVAALAMAGGGPLSWTVAPGHQNQPYAITGVASSTASCSFWGLN